MPSVPTRQPEPDCRLCPRLADFRTGNRGKFPDWHNAPVPSFGDADARLLIVGLAPGLRGANCTGRPFTGDYAGDLLYGTLLRFGLAEGTYGARPDDELRLVGCRITNAVRCVPPENRPTGRETTTCRPYLEAEIVGLEGLQAILALGTVAHGAVVAAFGERKSRYPFRHGGHFAMPGGITVADSYHCSRYNTNTGRLTESMFHTVFESLIPLFAG